MAKCPRCENLANEIAKALGDRDVARQLAADAKTRIDSLEEEIRQLREENYHLREEIARYR